MSHASSTEHRQELVRGAGRRSRCASPPAPGRASKFTQAHSSVRLNAYATSDRIRIDVEDQCGGLPDGNAEKMFLPFVRRGGDLSGLGLGLALSRRSVELFGGTLTAQSPPTIGCVFTVNLPRFAVPSPVSSASWAAGEIDRAPPAAD